MKTVPTEEQTQALTEIVEFALVQIVEGFSKDPIFEDLAPSSLMTGLTNNLIQAACDNAVWAGITVDQLHRFLDVAFATSKVDVAAMRDALRDIAGRN